MPDTVPPPPNDASEPPENEEAGDEAPVTFKRWAKLSARLFRRSVAMRAALIHEAGLDENWTEVDNYWFRELEGDLERGEIARLEQYVQLIEQERLKRVRDDEEVPSPLDEIFPPEQYPDAPRPKLDSATPASGTSSSQPPQSGVDPRKAAAEAMSWPLEKYAWLCAELEHAPSRAEHVWSLHGLADEEARRLVQKAWDEQLEDDEEVKQEHSKLVDRYKSVLQGD
jgi:hypothetical protein